MGKDKTLVVITGPTGSGKSDLAVRIARELGTEIVSADSRQIYCGLPIGTAAPTPGQLASVKHHLIGVLPLEAYYSAASFEADALDILGAIWQKNDYAVMCGGSMMYVDAVVHGIDDLPTISEPVRSSVKQLYQRVGLEGIRSELMRLDPEYYAIVDKNNAKRIIHAIEIIAESGRTYSSFRTGKRKDRPFNILRFYIDWPRDELFSRINARVDAMIAAGLVDEARAVYDRRELNSLNTVGYKELFAVFDGAMSMPDAIARIGKNTRVYAKKQLTWIKRNPDEYIALSPAHSFQQAMNVIKGY
ncbi:MAG: tRNA (adenosine(37)-N6)-dimethylallyltransferase MiaA [Muribaculaceae bacterium]|nr:tRNA (adenosine(37)-N6)-dimethylallyltransferase MiaA [Muribaculaceae bacterium]